MDKTICFPMKNGTEYQMPFRLIPESQGDTKDTELYMAEDILKWGLLPVIEELGFMRVMEQHSPDDDILDMHEHGIHTLISHLGKFAPSGYALSLPTDDEWIKGYNSGIIKRKDIPYYVELTETWDYERCHPNNSTGSGVSYFSFSIDSNGFERTSVLESYSWPCPVGLRLVLRKKEPSKRMRITEAVKLAKSVGKAGAEILVEILENKNKYFR